MLLFVLFAIIVFQVFINQYDGFSSRLEGISVKAFFNNTRFQRTIDAFNTSGTHFFSLLFGHGIGERLVESSQYYAYLLFETGILGCGLFLWHAIKGIMSGIKYVKHDSKGV